MWWQKLWTDPVATFTAVLAIFTIALAFATIQAANAAKAAAELVPALERAYVFVEINSIGFNRKQRSHYSQGTYNYEETIFWPHVQLKITNYGNTPAVLKEISGSLVIKPTMAAPEFKIEGLPQEAILIGTGVQSSAREVTIGSGVNEPKSYILRDWKFEELPEKDNVVQELLAGKTFLWLSGRIVYDDVFGKEHVTRFWFRNIEKLAAMLPHRGAEFNSRT